MELETIPEKLLLETPSLSSALQVFASVGGLSLLAERLPILYPELARHPAGTDGMNTTAAKDMGSGGGGPGLGHDWVTVESTDDLYDVGLLLKNIFKMFWIYHYRSGTNLY